MPTEELFHSIDEFIESVTSNDHFLKIFYSNIRSIKAGGKFQELKHKLAQLNYPDIIVLTETWLREGEEVLFQIPDYTLFSVVRNNKRGGGIIAYVRKFLDCDIFSQFTCETNFHQILSLSIK